MTTIPPTTLVPTTLAPDSVVILTGDSYRQFGPIELQPITIQGQLVSLSSTSCIIELDPLEIIGSFIEGQLVPDGMIELGPIAITGLIYIQINECNWVWWSDIGSLQFTINERNVAGKRPMDWKGCVYDILKLDEAVVVYGTNGVTMMKAVENKWGMRTVHRYGLPNKGAVDGTDKEHYFIDTKDRLHRITSEKGIELLDFSEYLSLLTSPQLRLDTAENILYICDGTYGFVFGTRTGSFGEGPINITGIGSQSSTLYVTAPAEIEIPKFHIVTDMYDLGSRKTKTIQRIEVGTDLTDELEVMVEMRRNNSDTEFFKSRWVRLNPSGIAYIPAVGVEFKFHIRAPHIYEYFEIDYIKVFGVVHGTSYLDTAQ